MKKIICAVLLTAFIMPQAFAACNPKSAAKVQRSDGYLKVCSGGTLELNAGAIFTATAIDLFVKSLTATYGVVGATGSFSGAVDIVGQVTMGAAATKSTVTATGAAAFSASVTAPAMVVTGTGASAFDVAGGINAGTGDVGIVDATGKIPALSSTYIANLSGANLTSLTAANVAAGSLGAGVIASSVAVGAIGDDQLAGSIPDSKLATISTAGKVADTALSANVPLLNSSPTISGTYTFENVIAGSVSGNAATATDAANHIAEDATDEVHGSTSANVASSIVARDGSGNFTAGVITAALTGNATTSTNATDHIAEGATDEVHGSTATNVASTIVARDGSGNFAAGTITAALTGAASQNALKSGDTFIGKVGLAVKTIVELEGITPAAVGEVYFCSDTSPARIAVSTGTGAGDFSDSLGLTLY